MSYFELVTSKSLKFLFSQVGNNIHLSAYGSTTNSLPLQKLWWLWASYAIHMDLAMVFQADCSPSYRVPCYVSHRHASEDAVSEIGFFLS